MDSTDPHNRDLKLVRPERKSLSEKQKRLAYVTFSDVLNGRCEEARVYVKNGELHAAPWSPDGPAESA